MRKCPHCDGAVSHSTKEEARVVSDTCFVVRTPAYACRRCRAVFTSGETLERVDIEIASVLALKGPLIGETLRFMRKALGLRGFVLAALLDVTGETVSRWENGQRDVDPNVWVLVGSLVLEHAGHPPTTMARLVGLKKRSKLPKTIRLDITEKRQRAVVGTPPPRSGRTRVSRVARSGVA